MKNAVFNNNLQQKLTKQQPLKYQTMNTQYQWSCFKFTSGFPKMGQVAPVEALTDIEGAKGGAMSSKMATGGP